MRQDRYQNFLSKIDWNLSFLTKDSSSCDKSCLGGSKKKSGRDRLWRMYVLATPCEQAASTIKRQSSCLHHVLCPRGLVALLLELQRPHEMFQRARIPSSSNILAAMSVACSPDNIVHGGIGAA
eukprot:764346-Hanusia_phi.AAC.2